jgi:hypothetical protein
MTVVNLNCMNAGIDIKNRLGWCDLTKVGAWIRVENFITWQTDRQSWLCSRAVTDATHMSVIGLLIQRNGTSDPKIYYSRYQK